MTPGVILPELTVAEFLAVVAAAEVIAVGAVIGLVAAARKAVRRYRRAAALVDVEIAAETGTAVDPDAVLDDVYALWFSDHDVDEVFAELTSPGHWGVEVLPYVMDDWTTDDVIDGDRLALDARFAAITRAAAETWRADA